MQKAEALFYTSDVGDADVREWRCQLRPIFFLFTVDLLSKKHALHAMSLCNTQTSLFNSGQGTAYPFLLLKNSNALGTHS